MQTGGFTDPRAERYVAAVLKARRDKIGRYYFSLVNPLDHFELMEGSGTDLVLTFENLAVLRGYAPSPTAIYRYSVRRRVRFGVDSEVIPQQVVIQSRITIPFGSGGLEAPALSDDFFLSVEIQTSYDGGERWSPRTSVYLRFDPLTKRLQLAGVDRES